MTDEQAKRACNYMAGQLSVKNCNNCRMSRDGMGEDIKCVEHQNMPVSYFGVCRDWLAREGKAK